MIDFDPNTQDALMPADTAMRFMTWASYYNGLDLTPGKSFADFSRNGKRLFAKEEAARLDRLKGVLFKCFEPVSVANATAALKRAKALGEPCPFTEASLNALFGTLQNGTTD